MSNHLPFALLCLSVLVPLILAFVVWKMKSVEAARRWSVWTLAFSLCAALLAGAPFELPFYNNRK